jgi:hypothetical protein
MITRTKLIGNAHVTFLIPKLARMSPSQTAEAGAGMALN